jgi:hypothetical protein
VGEIGIPRREFLYDIRFWEVCRIVRGYRKRNRLTHQLLAEIVYTTTYTMRDPKGKTPADMFPGIFMDEADDINGGISEEDPHEMLALIDAENARLAKSSEE